MSQIVYYEDIIEELSEELGIDEKELSEICKNSIQYIHHLTKNPNVISIRLPRLGVLHFNTKRAKFSYTNSNTFRNYVDIIKNQIETAESLKENHKDLAHTRTSYYSIVRKFFFPDKKKRIKSTKKEVYEKLELRQNKIVK